MARVRERPASVDVGDTVGEWTILGIEPRIPYEKLRYRCRCACGKESLVQRSNLLSGGSLRCADCGHALFAKPLAERFEALADRSAGPDACHRWLGATRLGYGHLIGDVVPGQRRKYVDAHRYALETRLGRAIVDGMYACHACDNRWCVNGRHLFEGTARDNMADKVAKGRQPFGARHYGSKYAAHTSEVRRLRAAGFLFREISATLGIPEGAAQRLSQIRTQSERLFHHDDE